eukprot:m.30247 g.30247  ORF g.30247 m.30247 type:complete len:234 (-) comp12208_c0_seq1:177-878(-)
MLRAAQSADRLLRMGRKCVAVGKNYTAHVDEMAATQPMHVQVAADAAKEPLLFLMPTTSYAYPGDDLVIPPGIGEVHHELELGVIIGKVCTRATAENWRDYVAGYVLGLDMTARDLQVDAKRKGLPWSVAKGMDTFTPLSGVVSADAIADPHELKLSLRVNGELRMSADTGRMVHKIPNLIQAISAKFTLEPGDLILTGTPEGVAAVFPGDVMEAGVEGFPELSIVCNVTSLP